jgi:hypothetical protein
VAPRSREQRKADTMRMLESEEDAWIATSGDGGAHLVPLSIWWDGEIVTIATSGSSLTARNSAASGRARVALGGTRDVVMIDGRVESIPLADAPEAVSKGFADARGWDPGWESGEWVYLRIRPERVQAWRESDEIEGRTIMRDGRWLD